MLQRAFSGCQALKAVLRCLDFSHGCYEQLLRYCKPVVVGYGLNQSFSKHKNNILNNKD